MDFLNTGSVTMNDTCDYEYNELLDDCDDWTVCELIGDAVLIKSHFATYSDAESYAQADLINGFCDSYSIYRLD